MEKKKLLTLPLPIEDCFNQLSELVPLLGWVTVNQNPDTYHLHWRKGDSWLIKRRHDLKISLVKRATRATELIITIKDPRIIWGGGELIAQDLAQVVEHIQAGVKLVAR
jgi:hypothetical protein